MALWTMCGSIRRVAILHTVFLPFGRAATGPAVGEVRTGTPHPTKAPDCPLEFVAVSAGDMWRAGRPIRRRRNDYEMIGAVNIGASEGTDPMSEETRRIVRPRACAMGGEVVSLLASGTAQYRRQFTPQQNISFVVWSPTSARPTSQRF